MNKMCQNEELIQSAIAKTVDEYCKKEGINKTEMAERLRKGFGLQMSSGKFYNCLNPYHKQKFNVDQLQAIVQLTEDPRIGQALVAMTEKPKVSADAGIDHLPSGIAEMTISTGSVAEKVTQSAADNRITPNELKGILGACASLRAWVRWLEVCCTRAAHSCALKRPKGSS